MILSPTVSREGCRFSGHGPDTSPRATHHAHVTIADTQKLCGQSAASSLLLFKELVGGRDHPMGFVLRAIIGKLDEHLLVLISVDHGRLRVIAIVPVEPIH